MPTRTRLELEADDFTVALREARPLPEHILIERQYYIHSRDPSTPLVSQKIVRQLH